MESTYLFDGHDFTHKLGGVEGGYGSVSFFPGFHRHEAKPTGFAGVRVIHDGRFFNLAQNMRPLPKKQTKDVESTYTTNLREGCFEVTGINLVTEPRDVEVVSGIGSVRM